MSCDPILDLLPWLANGTLDPAERDGVAAHLADCSSCRAALDDTLLLGVAASAHLPIDLLLDLADGIELSADDAAWAERHLAECPSCAAELGWARLDDEPSTPRDRRPADLPRQPARSGPVPWLALAAVLALAVVGLSIGSFSIGSNGSSPWWRSASSETTAPGAPIVRATLLELVPETVERGNAEAQTIALDGDASHLTLVLISDAEPPDGADLKAELIGPGAESLWIRDGLIRSPSGLYTVVLPTASLVPGAYRLRILIDASSAEPLLESFHFQVDRSARPR